MELVKIEKLHFKDDKSDKVYEVELYRIQNDEFIVNFRYGRRGKALREGTKTVFPIPKTKAELVFDDLVNSKVKKGYIKVQSYSDTILQKTSIPEYEFSGARAVVLSYLNKKAEGKILDVNWKLSRIIWRAGELEISEAVTPIKELLPTLDGHSLYSAVWTLGRIANNEATQILETITLNQEDLHYRILIGALIKTGNISAINKIKDKLPDDLKTFYLTQSYDQLHTAILAKLSIPRTNKDYLLDLYYLAIDDQRLKQIINSCLLDIELIPGTWRYIRYIYKISEMIKDGETFGHISRLVNLRSQYYNKNVYSDRVWLNDTSYNTMEALTSDEPQLAFSNATKDYFIRRTLRRLRKAGEDQMESYCELAAGILMAYSEKDAGKTFSMNFHNYDWESRTHTNEVHTYPPMSAVPYYYYIIFGRGNRFQIQSPTKRFYSTSENINYIDREDSFGELWDRYPHHAVNLLANSKQRDAMLFAMKILEDRKDLEDLLTLKHLSTMLSNPFTEVIEFSLEYIRKKYSAEQHDPILLLKLLQSKNDKAINLLVEFLDKNPASITNNIELLQTFLISDSHIIHSWLRNSIPEESLSIETTHDIIAYCLEQLKLREEEIENDLTQETLVQIFPVSLKQLDSELIISLINHPLYSVKVFGAKLMVLNDRGAEEWPSEIMLSLLKSEHATLRKEGVSLFSNLTDAQLLKRTDLIIDLASSQHQDLREQSRNIIGRLSANEEFSGTVFTGLYHSLYIAKNDDELNADIYTTIELHLAPQIVKIKSELDIMLKSNIREIHLLTYKLLELENLNDWKVGQIAKLGAHDMKTIRMLAYKYFNENIEKVKYENMEAIKILDSDWEETRTFAQAYFNSNYTEKEWEPNVVISLCDSIRPQTQDYGTRILGKYFKAENGEKFLVALSEHPDPIIELYSTNYLNQFAFNNTQILSNLKPYFVRILSAINSRRVAKDRVINFLEKQSTTSKESAVYVADILNELVGTIMIQENEKYVSLLYKIKQEHPEININIEKVALEIR